MESCESGAVNQENHILLTKIEQVADRVENLRATATYVAEEKDAIYLALDTIKHKLYTSVDTEDQRDDLIEQIDNIALRMKGVSVSIEISRNSYQQDALSEVNELINEMIISSHGDLVNARNRCISYLNTCKSDPEAGATDKIFENALLGCALDDQKRIRRRLHGLLSYLSGSKED